MSLQEINIKEYDSVAIHCQYSDDNNIPKSLEGIKINSDIMSEDKEYNRQLEVKIVNSETGEFVLFSNSISLAAKRYLIDVLFETIETERRISSESFILNVHAAVTKPRW